MERSAYIDLLRGFIKDHEGLNRLLEFEKESEDSELDAFLNLALNDLNFIPPHIQSWTIEDFPYPNLLVSQAAIQVLVSNGIVNSRNELQYNNGDVAVKLPDGNKYMNHLNVLLKQNQQRVQAFQQMKVKTNMERAYGIIGSPYSYLEYGILNQNLL